MAKGMLHTHLLVVVLFLLLFAFKFLLLFAGKTALLDKVRAKTKIGDMVLGTLILVTGGYLLAIQPVVETWMWVKTALVIAGIPLGIIGMKKGNKALSGAALILFIYVYGVAETKSLKFKRDKIEITTTQSQSDAIVDANQDAMVNNGKLIFEQVCAQCHGTNGKLALNGAKDLTESVLSSHESMEMIMKGKGLMAGYKDVLSEKDIIAVNEYVLTLRAQ